MSPSLVYYMNMSGGVINGLRLRDEDAFGVGSRSAGDITVGGQAPAPPVDLRPVEVEAPPTGSLFSSAAFHRGLFGFADGASVAVAVAAVLALSGKSGTAVAALACVPLVLLLGKLSGLYDRDELRLLPSTVDEAPRLVQVTGLSVLALAILGPALLPTGVSGLQIAMLWVASFLAVTSGRVLVRSVTGRMCGGERCLVVGDVQEAHHIRDLLADTRSRARVIACLPLDSEDVEELDIPTVAPDLIRDLQVDRIIVALPPRDASGGSELIRMAKTAGVSVSVVSRMFDAIGSDVEFDEVNGMTLLGIRRVGLSGSSRLLKRAFDIVVASTGLLASGPVILAIALAIRLDSKGPVFFRQVRVGRDGKHFRMIKFRSMISDADAFKDELRPYSERGDGLFKIADDPRVTAVGRLLRRSSLDELPQIFNVLRGEMSLVGPRPLVVDEDARIAGLARSRLDVTPGMTGPWQVLGSRLPMHEMVELDYRYASNWSLWLDVKLLVRTVLHVLRRSNV